MWTPEEWQTYCLSLLRVRHGERLQRVPDHDRGDLGIEAFCREVGHVYQCYAPEEPLSTAERYTRLRDKISADIKKLRDNDVKLTAMVGRGVISLWVFMTPEFDSRRIVEHCTTKAAEVLCNPLDCLSESFEIVIVNERDYPAEKAALSGPLADLGIDPVEADAVDALARLTDTESELVDNLDGKILKMPLSSRPKQAQQFKSNILAAYGDWCSILGRLETDHPLLWVRLQKVNSSIENNLALRGIVNPKSPEEAIDDLVIEYRERVRCEVPAVGGSAERIAWGQIGDWLLRCPLDFEELQHG